MIRYSYIILIVALLNSASAQTTNMGSLRLSSPVVTNEQD